jgi:hypothetical protein
MKTRRRFLLDGSAILLGAMFTPVTFASTWFRPMKAVSVADLHLSTFEPHLNTLFAVKLADGQELGLELAAVHSNDRKKSEAHGDDGERFSLVFRGPREKLIGQGMYAFAHPGIGRFELFIVPVVSRDQSRASYEAVFNRLGESVV